MPEQKRLRYIVHTDCKNEADDQFTLAHILMTDKLDVRGIIAGHFDEGNHGRYPEHQTALFAYYGSADWFADRELPLPPGIRAGVLSEDLVYDEITDLRDEAFRMLTLATEILRDRI